MTFAPQARPLRVGFIHPELGIGGAERLVVDAAVALQAAGHRVTVFTAGLNPSRCFTPTRDGTLDVRVRGSFLPSQIGQRLRAPCAIVRMAWLAWALSADRNRFDIIFCDLVSHAIPLLRLRSRVRVLFYCHFPDQLLAANRPNAVYRLYRAPIDRLEATTTGMAHKVLVNSRYTESVFRRTFPRLRETPVEVLYPGVDLRQYRNCHPNEPSGGGTDNPTILCISRFERKKNMQLAIEALALLRQRLAAGDFARLRLVIAGGCDPRLPENRQTLEDLRSRARRLDLAERVIFKPSCSDRERLTLLARCFCVLYTPQHEHFGLVPLEAMAAARAVIAVNSGGPRETVCHEETGFLCEATPEAFAAALARLAIDPSLAERMGKAGRAHVARNFSLTVFGDRLQAIIRELARSTEAGR